MTDPNASMGNGSNPPPPEADALHKAIALVMFAVVEHLGHQGPGDYLRHIVPPNLSQFVLTALGEVSPDPDPAQRLHWERVGFHARLILQQVEWLFGHNDTDP